jgi:single-strand DNA-binding protein
MNNLRNRVMIIGNLGQDPEIKTLEAARKVAHFTMLTNDAYKNNTTVGNRRNNLAQHRCMEWFGRTCRQVPEKGREVAVDGRRLQEL